MDHLEELGRLAAALRLDADRVQRAAARVRSLGRPRWRSPAGEAFAARADQRARGLSHGAEELRRAAEAVERHRAAVLALRAGGAQGLESRGRLREPP